MRIVITVFFIHATIICNGLSHNSKNYGIILQDSLMKVKKAIWVDFGFGASRGFTGAFDVNVEIVPNYVLSMRLEDVEEFDSESAAVVCPDELNSQSVSLMLQRIKKLKHFLFGLGAGPAIVDFQFNPCNSATQYHRVFFGFNVIGSVFYYRKYWAIGAVPLLNINKKENYGGFTINLGLGRFK